MADMAETFNLLPQLADLIQKGGVVGVMLIFCAVLVWEIRRGRRQLHDKNNELAVVYGQRGQLALAVVKLKTVCEEHNIKVDLSDLKDLLPAAMPALANGG